MAVEAAILDRNSRYLDNIATEHRPVILGEEEKERLTKCIINSCEDVFDISKEQMAEGAKYKDEVRARVGTAEAFRILTNFSRDEIGQIIGTKSVNENLNKSRKLLGNDIFYSAFVLTSVIKAYRLYSYQQDEYGEDTQEIIDIAQNINSVLPNLE